MASGGPTFTVKEEVLFQQVYDKVRNKEWDTAKAARFFQNKPDVISKFNAFCDIKDNEKEREILARLEALDRREAISFRSIERSEQIIGATRSTTTAAIKQASSKITVKP